MSKDKLSIIQKLARLLGRRIRQERENQELAPDQGAQRLKVSTAFYESLESGVALPSPAMLRQLSRALSLAAPALSEVMLICEDLAQHSQQLASIIQRLAGQPAKQRAVIGLLDELEAKTTADR